MGVSKIAGALAVVALFAMALLAMRAADVYPAQPIMNDPWENTDE